MYKLTAMLVCWLPLSSIADDCAAAYQRHLKTDLSLSYQEFDQTMDAGFRALASFGCEREAALLIERYIARNGAEQSSLRWHIAQLLATAGDYPAAIASARMTLRSDEDFSQHPLRWNDYVLATIAFLEADREALLNHRNEVAKGANEYFGNQLNLKLLDSLLRNFGQGYKYAAEHIE